jgi:hypothetical protein
MIPTTTTELEIPVHSYGEPLYPLEREYVTAHYMDIVHAAPVVEDERYIKNIWGVLKWMAITAVITGMLAWMLIILRANNYI